MSKFKMHQLGGDSACNKRRHFKYQVTDKKGDNYYKACAVLQATKAIIKGESLEGIQEEMRKAFDEIPYQDQQRELLLSDSFNQIKRYLDWEKRPLCEAVSANIDLYGKMTVEVTPNFIVADAAPVYERVYNKSTQEFEEIHVADGTIEIIKLKTGKPMSERAAKESLELFSLLQYGRKFYRQGKLRVIGSYYYLKRTDDSYGQHPSFKPFDNAQIRCISEIYEGKENETDEKFTKIVESFVNGHEEEDCNPKDCEKCILYDVCKGYSEGPISVKREIQTKARDILLNRLQQEAVDY